MHCFTWCGYNIEWNAWGAIGTILGAIATFVAVRVALILPRREHEIARKQIDLERLQRARDAATMLLPIISFIINILNNAKLHLTTEEPNEFGVVLLPPGLELLEVHRLAEFIQWMDCLDQAARGNLAKLIGWAHVWNSAFQLKERQNSPFAQSVHDAGAIAALEKLRMQLFETAESLEKWAESTQWGGDSCNN